MSELRGRRLFERSSREIRSLRMGCSILTMLRVPRDFNAMMQKGENSIGNRFVESTEKSGS